MLGQELEPTTRSDSGVVNVDFLQERIRKLEAAVERSQVAFEEMMTDVFTSVPAKASIFESGSIPQPFHKSEKLEVCFGRRFKSPPRVIAWILLRETSSKRSPSAAQADQLDGSPAYHIEDNFKPESIKIGPSCIETFEAGGHSRARFTITPDVVLAAGTNERKESSVLYWMAWEAQISHPKITASLKRIYLTGNSLPRQLKNEIQTCIDQCGGVNATDGIGQTFLHAAACTGNNELVNWLLHKGADIESFDDQGWTPLLGAISSQHEDTASLLLKKGATPTSTCERGMTCLHLLARWPTFTSAQERLARELVAAGADINAKNDAGETPLLHLCRKRENCTLVAQLMLELGADVTIPDMKGWTPLHMAAAADNIALINLLISAGARKDAAAKGVGTPLIVAVKKHSCKAIRALLDVTSVAENAVLLRRIFGYLPPEGLHSMMSVSKRFCSIAREISADKDYWYTAVGIPKEGYIEYVKLRRIMARTLSNIATEESALALKRRDKGTSNGNTTTTTTTASSSSTTITTITTPSATSQFPGGPATVVVSPTGGVLGTGGVTTINISNTNVTNNNNNNNNVVDTSTPAKFVVAVAGGRTAGKSNFLTKFCEGAPDPYASYVLENKAKTFGQAFCEESAITTVAERTIEVTLIEAPWRDKPFKNDEEEEIYQSIWARADGCVVLMDATKKGDEDKVIRMLREWEEGARTSKQKNVVVCAAKCDISHRGFISNCYETLRYCDSKDILFADVSCMDDTSVQSAVKYLLLKLLK